MKRIILLLACGLFAANLHAARPAKKPSLVFILADDLGNPVIQTPTLDRLCHQGLAFTRAYMQGGFNGATCVPSRAMPLTNPLSALIQDTENGTLTKPRLSNEYLCAVAADEAIRFMREQRDGSFFCYVAFDAPHDPHIVPSDFPLKYDLEKIPLPPNFLPQHPFDNGEMKIRDEVLLPHSRTPEAVRQMNADYYRYITFLDALAASGVRFTQGYAACAVCSPTRAALVTGKYPARLRITDWISGKGAPKNRRFTIPDWQQHLPLEETTLAGALKKLGYTTAHSGKWHLGNETYFREHQGFDTNIAGSETGHEELYDLKTDLSEQNEFAAANPERRKQLSARLDAWLKEVGAQMPLPR